MKLVAILSIGLLFFACGSKKSASEKTPKENNTYPITMDIIKVKATIGQFVKNSDPIINIDTVEVRGNIMYIDVSYGGGCEEHQFEVIGSLAIAKSLPPIRAIQLVHHSNGDKCRAIKKVKLEVYLEEIAYQKEEGSEIYYTLEGWKDRIYHKYQEKK